jgi:hypothetical protein
MFSVTGEHAHGQFGDGNAKLVWGLAADGTLAKISEVERGKRCGCVCPACQLPLIAKKGRKLAEHFAHEGGNACSGVRETNAHAWAKQILEQRKKLWLPADHAVAGDWSRKAFSARYFDFEGARLEKRAGDIVPDVVLSAKGRELIVEILVTHACDEVKVAKIREQGVSALEIDLSGYRHAQSEDEVADALIGGPNGGAYREWLFNAKTEERSRLLAEEKARKAAEREAKREAERRDQIRALVQAARSIRIVSTDATMGDLQTATDYEISKLTSIHRGDLSNGFRVIAKLWQSAVWARVLIPASAEWGTMFGVREIIRELEDCIAPAFRKEPPEDVQKAVRHALPGFRFPSEAVAEYLFDLMQQRAIEFERTGYYRLKDDLSYALDQRRDQLEARRKRQEQAMDRIRAILSKIPTEEKAGFSLNRWLEQPITHLGIRFGDMVESGSDGWEVFQLILGEMERMFSFGQKPAQVTLGLPIEGAIARAAERERVAAEKAERERIEAEEQAKRDRGAWLTRHAVEKLGESKAVLWLSSEAAEGGTHFTLAESSAEGYRSAETKLEAAVARARREEMASRYRARLAAAALGSLGPERARLFMTAKDPRLGMSPSERCTDPIGLRDCLSLLPKRGR